MIDAKIIVEAAIQNADKYNPCRSTLDMEEACRASFKDGVEWFKKVLWHDASEEPQKDQPFITQWKNLWIVDINHSIFPNNDWFSHCKKAEIKQWAYIADLLPKGGGK